MNVRLPKNINTPLDKDRLKKSIHSMYDVSFDRLYIEQKETTTVDRITIYSRELRYMDTRSFPQIGESILTYMYLTIPYTFIDALDREKYKKSVFYNKVISINDVVKNKEVFRYFPLIFIKGNLCTDNIRFIIEEDRLFVLFNMSEPLFPGSYALPTIKELMNNNIKLDFVMVKNGGGLITFSNSSFNVRNKNGVVNYLESTDLKKSSKITEDEYSIFSSLKFEFNNMYSEGTSFNGSYNISKNSNINIDISKDIKTERGVVKTIALNLHELLKTVELSQDEMYVVIDDEDGSPLPVENMICYIKDIKTGRYIYDDSVNIELFYPRMYKITRTNNNPIRIQVFKNKSIDNTFIDYTRILYKYSNDVSALYEMDKIPNDIKDYRPYNINSTLEAFNESGVEDIDLWFKSQLVESIQNNPEYMREYLVKRLYQYYPNNVIKMDKENINKRRRLTTSDFYKDNETLPFPCLAFMLINDPNQRIKESFQLFIEGWYTEPDLIKEDVDKVVFYFDERKFFDEHNNPLEVLTEAHYPLAIDKVVEFDTLNDEVTVNLVNRNGYVLKKDLFLYNIEEEKFVTQSEYDVFLLNYNKYELIENEEQQINNHDIKINIKNESLLGKRLRISVYNHSSHTRIEAEHDKSPCPLDLNVERYRDKVSENVRVYRNDVKILDEHLSVQDLSPNKLVSSIRVKNNLINPKGTRINGYYLPRSSKRVFYKKEMDPKLIVDLRGVIKNIFDLRWFVVFLNGRRLGPNNIEYLSPKQFRIKNVSSFRHLEIYEYDSYRGDFVDLIQDTTMEDVILDLVKDDMIEKIPSHPDDEVNQDDLTRPWEETDFQDFLDWLSTNFVNPNKNQVKDWMKTLWSIVFWYQGDLNSIYLNPNRNF